MPAEQYRAATGISKSMLDWITPDYPGRKRPLPGGSPAHFRARWIAGEIEEESTPAQRYGRILHRALLEPDTMHGAFHEKPPGMKFTTKAGRAWQEAHQDREIITADEAARINSMVAAVHRHPAARAILTGARIEQSLFAEDAEGTLRKGRLDAILPGNGIADLKTIECASEGHIDSAIWDYRLFVQGAYYLALTALCGVPKESFVLIFVENSPPYDVVCLELDDEAIRAGTMCFEHDLRIYRECLANDRWPGRSASVGSIGLPEWARKSLEKERLE